MDSVIYGIPFPAIFEFAKLVIILLVARYLTNLKKESLESRELIKLGALVGVPMLLVMRQPDLGTSLTYLPIVGVGLFLAGLSIRQMTVLAMLGIVTPVVAYNFLLKDYQKARLTSFLDPQQVPQGLGIR